MIRNKKLVDGAVLDEQGRKRFHGAFTGEAMIVIVNRIS